MGNQADGDEGPVGAPPSTVAMPARRRRRRRPWLLAVPGVLVVLVGYLIWMERPDRRTGPDPTVAEGDSCGGGVPSAVLAVDVESGELRWSALVGHARSLAVSDGTVVAVGGDRIRALAASDGRERWCREAWHAADAVGADGVIAVRTPDRVRAYRTDDGSPAWEAEGRVGSLTDDGALAVTLPGLDDPDGATRGLDLASGTIRWETPTPSNPYATTLGVFPLFAAPDLGLTFVHDGVGTRAMAAPGERWSKPVFRPIGVADDALLGGVPFDVSTPDVTRFRLTSADAATGRLRWEREVAGFDARLADGVVAVVARQPEPGPELDEQGRPVFPPLAPSLVTGYEVSDGTPRWTREVPFAAAVHQAGDLVATWSLEGWDDEGRLEPARLTGIHADTGEVAWTLELDNPGRSNRYADSDLVLDAAYDAETDQLLVLVQAQRSYGD